MFLAKIKNKFMYKTDSDDYGSHWYLVYTRRNKFLSILIGTGSIFINIVIYFSLSKSGLIAISAAIVRSWEDSVTSRAHLIIRFSFVI